METSNFSTLEKCRQIDFRTRFSDLVNRMYSIEMSPESDKNLDIVRTVLAQIPQANLLICFNHRSFDDPLIFFSAYPQLDPHADRDLYVLSGDHVIGKWRLRASITRPILLPLSRRYGARLIPVVHAGEAPRFKTKSSRLSKALIERLRGMEHATLAMSPEGDFSKTGSLQLAHTGITMIIKNMKPVVIMPTGYTINSPNGIPCNCDPTDTLSPKYRRKGYNFGHQVTLGIGKPLFVPGEETITLPANIDTLEKVTGPHKGKAVRMIMQRLAATLPQEMWGPYSPEQP